MHCEAHMPSVVTISIAVSFPICLQSEFLSTKSWLTLQAGLVLPALAGICKAKWRCDYSPSKWLFYGSNALVSWLWGVWVLLLPLFCPRSCFTTCVVFAAGSPSSHGWQHPWASSLPHNIPVFLWLSLHLCCDFYFETWLTWLWPCWYKKSFSCVPVVAWLRGQKLLWGSQTDCRWLGGYLHCQNFVNMSPNKKPALFFKQVFFPFTAQHITSQKNLSSGRTVYDFLTSFYYMKLCNIHSV